MAGQPGTVGTGALHADRGDRAVLTQPRSQSTVARGGGRELPITAAWWVCPWVSIPPITTRVVGFVMLVMPCLFRWTGRVRHAAVGSVDKTVMGAWCAGSYEVTPPGRSRAVMLPAGSTDRSKDNFRVSRAVGQTQR